LARGLLPTGVTRMDTGEVRNCETGADDDDDDDDDDASGAVGEDEDDLDANAANGDMVNELIDDSVKEFVGEINALESAVWSRSARSFAFM